MNLSCAIARGNTALPACPAQSNMLELLESHAQCPISRHIGSPCCLQGMLLTNPIQMLSLLKESEVTLAAWPRKPEFQNGATFFATTE